MSASGLHWRGLSPQQARTFYNAVDAWMPPDNGSGSGAGAVDLVPNVEQILREQGATAIRRFGWWLRCVEWEPVVTLRARRSFSRLPRVERRAGLDRGATSRLGWRRESARQFEAMARRAFAAHLDRHSLPGA